MHDENREEHLLAELERLRQENQRLQQTVQDLSIALSTTSEHGDVIEAELYETNLKLKGEVVERLRVEATLQALIQMIIEEKSDLELIVQTIMEHGDVLDVQWRHKLHEVNQLATYDSLTQIANRRRFDEYLEQQWHQMARLHLPLSLVLCDIDHFKSFNDTYGHLAGDDSLQQVAQSLSQSLGRSTDLLARFGGEEFVVVLPQTSLEGAVLLAERLRLTVQNLQIPHTRSTTSAVLTVSLGVACITPSYHNSATQLIEAADRALYLAKKQGRNQVMQQLVSVSLAARSQEG